MSNYETFLSVYGNHLKYYIQKYPNSYSYQIEEVPSVALKMVAALKKGSASIVSPAIRQTCKDLDIRCSVSSIVSYLSEERKP